jgi:glycosyltransferase involved in cell wall biosynthesis
MIHSSYALVTAARDEEKHIPTTLQSVVSQTLKPAAWVIVSDGSTDGTDKIVKEFTQDHAFIQFVRLDPNCKRNFQSQVYAINAGFAQLRLKDYVFLGNLDADISLIPSYYEEVIRRFQQSPCLGLAGGWLYEPRGPEGAFVPRPYNSDTSVPHGIQLFRRKCFEEIGGYMPLPYGGPDWLAEVMARLKGWEVAVYRDLQVKHHKLTSSAEGILRGGFRQGRMDYFLGSHPLFEIFKCSYRLLQWPFFISAFVRMAGFVYSYLSKEKRTLPREFIMFLRAEQKRKLRSFFAGFGRG